MNAESLMHERGFVAVVVHKDRLNRAEKEACRGAVEEGLLADAGRHFVLPIQEEPVGDFEEEQELDEDPTTIQEGCSDEPSMSQLRSLTVAQLKDLAAMEEVDLSDLKLKDDILGRMAAHFGLDPAS